MCIVAMISAAFFISSLSIDQDNPTGFLKRILCLVVSLPIWWYANQRMVGRAFFTGQQERDARKKEQEKSTRLKKLAAIEQANRKKQEIDALQKLKTTTPKPVDTSLKPSSTKNTLSNIGLLAVGLSGSSLFLPYFVAVSFVPVGFLSAMIALN